MYRIVLFAIIISHVEFAFSDDCEVPWVKVGNKCLWKASTLATRAENLRNCRDVAATLVSPRTHAENELVKKFIGGEDGFFWLSGQRFVKDNPNYRWIDGSELKYGDWIPGQPFYYQYGSPVCMLVQASDGWYDNYCDQKFKQLCEKPIKRLGQSAEGDVTDSGSSKVEEQIKALEKKLDNQETKINTILSILSTHSDNLVIMSRSILGTSTPQPFLA